MGIASLNCWAYMVMQAPTWRKLLAQETRWACSRAFFRAGRSIEISSAMMPITTRSSTSVNPRLRIATAFLNPRLAKCNLMKDLAGGPTYCGKSTNKSSLDADDAEAGIHIDGLA